MTELSVYEFDSCQAFLANALEKMGTVNPSYSLRAFARSSGVSPAYLSRILSGKRAMSERAAIKIARALRMRPAELSYLQGLIELPRLARPEEKLEALERLRRLRPRRSRLLPLDQFKVIAEWFHFSLLVLSNTRGFKADPAWIGRRLGINKLQATSALKRLLELLGFLEKKGDTVVAANGGNIETPHDIASLAARENHAEHLRRAKLALDTVPVALREFSNLTLAMNVGDMPEAKRRIRQFVDSFNAEMEKNLAGEVCQLNIQFYVASKHGGSK